MALDKFAYSVPSFNFKGDQSIKTGLGACCSITITIVVLFYALLKLIQLLEGNNPTVAAFPVDTKFDVENPVNLNEIGFKVAFQFTSWDRKAFKQALTDDPNYVKMIVVA